MILVFDLDDTLYPEISYVKSGFREVSRFLGNELSIDSKKIYSRLIELLDDCGRGRVFDIFLDEQNRYSKSLVARCLSIYRNHDPKIALSPEIRSLLNRLKAKAPLYLVTDGNKLVQQRKIGALKLDRYFKKTFVTHNYGLASSKPSLNCFNKIAAIEGVHVSNIIYVGDDPYKDFVSLNRIGATTIRVRTGRFASNKVTKEFDAKITINSLSDLSLHLKETGVL